MPRSERDIVIGKVVAPHGIRGEVKVIVLTDFPDRFDVGSELRLVPENGESRKLVVEANRQYKGGLVLKLRGVETRDDSEAMHGAEFVIDESDLAQLPTGGFYVFDILGLKVVTDDGRELGEVTEVLQSGANDVYVTSTGLCIPALKDVIAKIDIDGGVIVVHPVPGLLAED